MQSTNKILSTLDLHFKLIMIKYYNYYDTIHDIIRRINRIFYYYKHKESINYSIFLKVFFETPESFSNILNERLMSYIF